MSPPNLLLIGSLVGGCLLSSCCPPEKGDCGETTGEDAWTTLLKGDSLDGWEVISYAGHGEVSFKEGAVRIAQGEALSGVRYTGEVELPTTDYEVELEARRIMGTDFFCCLTFPFQKEHASWVLGGWGGSVVGISSIDHMDAYDNETMKVREFNDEQWYKLRLRVTDHRIQAWIDNEDSVVNVNVKGRTVGMRFGEIEDSVPFGLSTFAVTGEMRNVRIRPLTDAEVQEALALDDQDEL